MRKLSLMGVAVAGFLLAACGPAAPVIETGVGYALVHGHYVGVAEVTTEDDVVTAISIDEYFLPYNWAKVSQANAEANPNDTLAVIGSRSTSYYAKYIKIGDKNFTGTVIGEAAPQTIRYAAANITDIETWVDTEANAIWYIAQLEANAFFLADADFAAHSSLIRSDATSNVAMTKSASGYWTVAAPGLGWSGNIAAVQTLLIGTTLDFTPEDFAKDGNGFWANGDLVSGATMTDFQDYIGLALRAYANRQVIPA